MKLLIITAAFPPMKSGGADYAMRFADYMADQGMDVHVLTSKGTRANATKYSVKPLIKNWSWPDAMAIHKVVKDLQPDIVDIHFTGWIYNDNPMITFAPAIIRHAAPKAHISVHIESLGGVRRQLSNPLDAAMRWGASQFVGRSQINYEYGSLVRDSDSLVFLNQRDLDELTGLVSDLPKKALIAPPPPIMPVVPPLGAEQVRAVRAEYGMEKRQIFVAFYGYIYPGKGIETLLSAVRKVMQKKKNIGLILAGGLPEQKALKRAGHPNYLEELKASARGIDERLCWIGYSQPDSDVPSKIMRACDICVLPFDQGVMLNNSSFSFAAMHGVPIITTQGKHTESDFVHGQNALLLPPRNADKLSDEILRLADDVQQRQELSQGALALAQDRFNWEKTVRATIQFWNSMQK